MGSCLQHCQLLKKQSYFELYFVTKKSKTAACQRCITSGKLVKTHSKSRPVLLCTAYFSQQLIMTPQQLEEELQQTRWIY